MFDLVDSTTTFMMDLYVPIELCSYCCSYRSIVLLDYVPTVCFYRSRRLKMQRLDPTLITQIAKFVGEPEIDQPERRIRARFTQFHHISWAARFLAVWFRYWEDNDMYISFHW